MTENELAISLQNVNYYYTKRKWFTREKYHALKNINLRVYRGETLGIQGRNGSGKSTLLKLLAGIYEPDSGVIKRYGNNISLQTLSAGFDVELTGEDNALIGAMLLGHSKDVAKRKREEIKELAELGDKFYDPVKTYSAGMRARLGFATAVTMHTDVLLIDEVLGVGDEQFRKKADQIIEDKLASEMTMIIVSHSEGLMNKLCQRIITIENGQLIE